MSFYPSVNNGIYSFVLIILVPRASFTLSSKYCPSSDYVLHLNLLSLVSLDFNFPYSRCQKRFRWQKSFVLLLPKHTSSSSSDICKFNLVQVSWPKSFPKIFMQLTEVPKWNEQATSSLPELKKIISTAVPAAEERTEVCGPAAVWQSSNSSRCFPHP